MDWRSYVAAGAMMVCLLSCSSGKADAEGGAQAGAEADMQGVEQPVMTPHEARETVDYMGKTFALTIHRRPDESLPHVVGLEGDEFVDNRIALRVKADGKLLVDRDFSRQSFAGLVPAGELRNCRLEAFLFEEATPQGLLFTAGLGYPQSDMFIPIRVVVGYGGQVSMEKGSLMD